MPYDESDDYDVYEIIDQAYNEADRMSRPIHLLLETYQKYEEHDPNADRVADDNEALEWLDDYWEYVKWNEHGNESSIDEVGGFKGFAHTVTDSDYVDATLNYLIYDDDPEQIDPTARDLADRLKNIANRYGALRKMKKMSFTERVCQYIKNNYDIPEKMEFYIGDLDYDFEDWVDRYIKEYNTNVSTPFDDNSDESDVEVVGEEILQIMTSPKSVIGTEYAINYDDFEASTKKSQDIHSMIADIRKNNNSLVKNRVDLSVNKYRNLQSVGPDYPLDVDRIVREMLDIIIQSREPNGDYALDEYGAYEEWEKRNYEIVAYDEDGDETYNEEIYDKLEDAFIKYRNRMKDELMDKIYDLEYNDLISIAGREVYVKSTNGNDSYEGCKIWCGPEEDDERGWYFDASDFEGVIRRSESGDNIWNLSW